MTRYYARPGDERVLECMPGLGANLHKICGSPEAARAEAARLNAELHDRPDRRQRLIGLLRQH